MGRERYLRLIAMSPNRTLTSLMTLQALSDILTIHDHLCRHTPHKVHLRKASYTHKYCYIVTPMKLAFESFWLLSAHLR